MNSLLSLLKDRKIIIPDAREGSQNSLEETLEDFLELHDNNRFVPINITSVLKDIINVADKKTNTEYGVVCDFGMFSRCMPPYEFTWLEGIGAEKIAYALLRQQLTEPLWNMLLSETSSMASVFKELLLTNNHLKDSGVLIFSYFFGEGYGAILGPIAIFVILLDSMGTWVDARWVCLCDIPAVDEEKISETLTVDLFMLANALFRMNCANVAIEAQTVPRKYSKKDKVPAIVWHDIKIKSVPKIVSISDGNYAHTELRSHWVRGHYADYTKGNGLFGNPKLKSVFWIPEFKRGSEEVGEVKQSYTLVK